MTQTQPTGRSASRGEATACDGPTLSERELWVQSGGRTLWRGAELLVLAELWMGAMVEGQSAIILADRSSSGRPAGPSVLDTSLRRRRCRGTTRVWMSVGGSGLQNAAGCGCSRPPALEPVEEGEAPRAMCRVVGQVQVGREPSRPTRHGRRSRSMTLSASSRRIRYRAPRPAPFSNRDSVGWDGTRSAGHLVPFSNSLWMGSGPDGRHRSRPDGRARCRRHGSLSNAPAGTEPLRRTLLSSLRANAWTRPYTPSVALSSSAPQSELPCSRSNAATTGLPISSGNRTRCGTSGAVMQGPSSCQKRLLSAVLVATRRLLLPYRKPTLPTYSGLERLLSSNGRPWISAKHRAV